MLEGDGKCHKNIDAAQPGRSVALPRRHGQSTLAAAIDKRSAWTAVREGAIVDGQRRWVLVLGVNPG